MIIGGGATGAGISRDLALRGIPSLLVEKDDFTSGASGRNQGLLHSGARYALNDLEAAKECITENRILRRIAPHCIEATDGLFVSLPEDGAEYRATFIRACGEAGIDTLPLSPREALSMEPKLNPRLIGAVQVPDGAIDPFTLVVENARDAESRGARVPYPLLLRQIDNNLPNLAKMGKIDCRPVAFIQGKRKDNAHCKGNPIRLSGRTPPCTAHHDWSILSNVKTNIKIINGCECGNQSFFPV